MGDDEQNGELHEKYSYPKSLEFELPKVAAEPFEIREILFALKPVVSGVLVDSEGLSVENVEVVLTRGTYGQVAGAGTTNENGQFEMAIDNRNWDSFAKSEGRLFFATRKPSTGYADLPALEKLKFVKHDADTVVLEVISSTSPDRK